MAAEIARQLNNIWHLNSKHIIKIVQDREHIDTMQYKNKPHEVIVT